MTSDSLNICYVVFIKDHPKANQNLKQTFQNSSWQINTCMDCMSLHFMLACKKSIKGCEEEKVYCLKEMLNIYDLYVNNGSGY